MVIDKQIHIKRKRKVTNINCFHTDLLKLEDVDILVYDFNLTKRGTLHFKTIDMLKKFLPEGTMLRWESAKPSHRCKRILKPEMVGMHIESDGTLVDERQKYGSSSTASSYSSDNVDSDGVLDTMDDFE